MQWPLAASTLWRSPWAQGSACSWADVDGCEGFSKPRSCPTAGSNPFVSHSLA